MHWFYFWRAFSHGPDYFLQDEIRRCLAEPLVRTFTDTLTEHHRTDLEHERAKHDRDLTHEELMAKLESSDRRFFAGLGMGIVLLGMAAGLFVSGQYSQANDLVKMAVPAGLGFLAGIGVESIRRGRGRRSDAES